jgi:hypothetical protein
MENQFNWITPFLINSIITFVLTILSLFNKDSKFGYLFASVFCILSFFQILIDLLFQYYFKFKYGTICLIEGAAILVVLLYFVALK